MFMTVVAAGQSLSVERRTRALVRTGGGKRFHHSPRENFTSLFTVNSNNQTPSSVERYTNKSTSVKDPIHFFFIERYEQAYRDQLDDFITSIINKKIPSVTFEDGRKALLLANAAYDSYETGKSIKVNLN